MQSKSVNNVCKLLQLLGGLAQTPYGAFAHGPYCGTFVPRPQIINFWRRHQVVRLYAAVSVSAQSTDHSRR